MQLFTASLLPAAEQHGTVQLAGVPVPGAIVTATANDHKLTAVTDQQGSYSFLDLADGAWTLDVEMPGFAPLHQPVTVGADAAPVLLELKMLPFAEIVRDHPPAPPQPARFQRTEVTRRATPPPSAGPPPESDPELTQKASDGLLVNGSQNNGASSPFSLDAAFGNNRRGRGGLYNGSLGFIFDTSALDARAFSLTGQDTPKPLLDRHSFVMTFGGPIRIPHIVRNGPVIFVGYQRLRNRSANTQAFLVPTPEQRNSVPASLVSPQARVLLAYYPLPNFTGSSRYNYQVPLSGFNDQDALQSRFSKNAGQRNQFNGTFAFQRVAWSNTNPFGFEATGHNLGLNGDVNWTHRFGARLFAHFQFQYSRQSATTTPYFAGRDNVSANAGISGNLQDPANWGPPSLSFSSGIFGLSDAVAATVHNQTAGTTADVKWNRGRHNLAVGLDFRRQQFNSIGQANPRGSFAFTGPNDFADFLAGIPSTAAISYGNADKYFRGNMWDAFVNDDWRVGPELTLNLGLRWEYGSPLSETQGRLVNLSLNPGFTAARPVVGNGSLQPDRHGIEPRLGLAWRPFPASSTVVRAGYGVYYNTSVYQNIAQQMAQQTPQQSPLSRSFTIQNTGAVPFTIANAFNTPATATPQTFAVDPALRVGYTQNWQASIQRDLPGSIVVTATYAGIKGTRGMQESLPNTYPSGAANPCLSCPSGFVYLTSNGNSTLESGQLQLRRRLRRGFTATLQYTLAKAMDDSALGGRGQATYLIAQNWRDLSAERGPSVFDQRHLASLELQYSPVMTRRLLKDWTATSTVTAGSGLPLTPVYLAAVSGSGVTGPLRPDVTGASVTAAPSGLYLNPAAFATPAAGQWGNAGRDSITGPSRFSVNASLTRTFHLRDRYNLDLRVEASNVLNHVTYTSWITTVNSAQFGLPAGANAMRSLQTTLRVRF